jgi:hypothetical protein
MWTFLGRLALRAPVNLKHFQPIEESSQRHTGLSLLYAVCYDASNFVDFGLCIELLTF